MNQRFLEGSEQQNNIDLSLEVTILTETPLAYIEYPEIFPFCTFGGDHIRVTDTFVTIIPVRFSTGPEKPSSKLMAFSVEFKAEIPFCNSTL